MRVKKSETHDSFKEFDIVITIESEEDAKKFHAIFNNPKNTKHIGVDIALDIIKVIESGLNVEDEGMDDSEYYKC